MITVSGEPPRQGSERGGRHWSVQKEASSHNSDIFFGGIAGSEGHYTYWMKNDRV
jgi:hypothetical protein